MNEGQPVRPANIEHIVAINQGKAKLTMREPSAPALTAAEFSALVDNDYVVVDTRPPAAFGGGHIPGAYNINLTSPEFEQRVGWVVPDGAHILLVLDNNTLAPTALRKLAFLGLDHRIEGFLNDGMNAWMRAGKPQASSRQISVHELQSQLDDGTGMKVLDVREADEWDEGHIEGSTSMSFKALEAQLAEIGIGPEDPVSVTCAGGVRSSTACSILQRNGYGRVRNLTGGMAAWKAAGLPIKTG
jgi:hydroxyacylglutathione hydrolase